MASASESDTEETFVKKLESSYDENHNDHRQGYTYDFVDEHKSKEYECPICLHVVRNPVLIPCGDIACKRCWTNWASKQKSMNEEISCPVCRVHVGTKPVVEDNYLARMVRNLHVYCINHYNGCRGSFVLSDIEEHQVSCGFQYVTCDLDCGDMILLNQQKLHTKNDCSKRLAACLLCQTECKVQDYEIQRKQLNKHHNTHVTEYVQQLNSTVIDLCATVGISPAEDISLPNKLPVNLLSDSVSPSSNVFLERETEGVSLIATVKRQNIIMKSLIGIINIQQHHNEKLRDDMRSLEQTAITLINHTVSLENQLKQQNEKIKSLEEVSREQSENISSLGTQTTSLEVTTMKHITNAEAQNAVFIHPLDIHKIFEDGPFIWTFPYFKGIVLQSKPFYTRNKYLFYFRINKDPCNDGDWLNVYLLKGRYDDKIEWPFILADIKGSVFATGCDTLNLDSDCEEMYPRVSTDYGQTWTIYYRLPHPPCDMKIVIDF